jgi:hypothetical protein
MNANACVHFTEPVLTKLQVPYSSPDTAQDAVRRGDAWGVLYFTENFTDALVARMALGKDSDEETLDQSEIRVWLDMSSKIPYALPLFSFCLTIACHNTLLEMLYKFNIYITVVLCSYAVVLR